MNPNSTRTWIIIAAALFVFIFFFERHVRKPEIGPLRILPEFKSATVTGVQVRPAGQLEIRAERTNGVWQLVRPVSYPAQATAIEGLLAALEHVSPATYIPAGELKRRSKFDAEFGFDPPQISLGIQQGEDNTQIWVGAKTTPGDQFFLQVVGREGMFVVDADLLKLIPRSADDWRDTAMVDLTSVVFDRIAISSGGTLIEFQRNTTNKLWGMTRPLQARADNDRITELLQELHALRVTRFVTDSPKADLEIFGLQPPELELSLAAGTNTVAVLQFGKSATNDASQLFARRGGVNSIVTVPKDLTTRWRAGVNEFRDHRLLTYDLPVNQIEIHGENDFVLQFNGSNSWKIVSESLPVDTILVNDFISELSRMQIVQFRDAVTGPDLSEYGLITPSKKIILRPVPTDGESTTNKGLRLAFGKVQNDMVFVQRSDEDSVYAVKLEDLQQLPTAPWQLRERRIWNFTENDVVRLAIRQSGRTRELVRNGTNSWSLAPGSQGDINVFGVEETVHRLGELSAVVWVSHGDEHRAQFGFHTNSLSLSFELKNGEKAAVEFADASEKQYPNAATTLGGETWIFQFPVGLYQFVLSYLAIPVNSP